MHEGSEVRRSQPCSKPEQLIEMMPGDFCGDEAQGNASGTAGDQTVPGLIERITDFCLYPEGNGVLLKTLYWRETQPDVCIKVTQAHFQIIN